MQLKLSNTNTPKHLMEQIGTRNYHINELFADYETKHSNNSIGIHDVSAPDIFNLFFLRAQIFFNLNYYWF